MPPVDEGSPLTPLGKGIAFLLILGLLAGGGYMLFGKSLFKKSGTTATSSSGGGTTSSGGQPNVNNEVPEFVETKTEVPKLPPPAPYQMKNNTAEIELSEYAGYAGLIVANGGLEPTEDSYFFKKHGFKVKLTVSEEESWPALNSGKLAASATTVDVLAVYGRQFQVVVPAQIGFSRGADGVVVRPDIMKINDMKGRILVTAQFTEAEFFIRYLCQEAGVGVNCLQNLNAAPDPQKLNLVFAETAFAAGDLFIEELKALRGTMAGCVTWAPKTNEVVAQSGGKARILTTNRNLLIVGDILIVNKGFAQQNPDKVKGLVDGLMYGNNLMRTDPDAHLETIAKAFKAFKWDRSKAKSELANVHFSNLPENVAFLSGAIDAAGSFSGIFQSAILAYGSMIRDPVDGERFIELSHLKALEQSGAYKDQKISIAPIRIGGNTSVETNPLLSKDIRFFFQPNAAELDPTNSENLKNLDSIKNLLQISPGSTLLLRGHVDDAQVEEFRKKGGESFVRQMALKAMELSKNRAGEIKKVLIEKHGIAKERLDIVGRGWEEPASKLPEENRRVEVQWFTVE